MKFISTNGREYKINIRPSKWKRRSKEECKSHIQWNVGQILDELYPSDIILEEFCMPGDNLYIDFFIPRIKLAVEVHGQQHFQYSSFFHSTKQKFNESVARDNRKREWCKINGVDLKVIRFDDSDEEIRNKLEN